jgi:protoporphyrinogen oxidase
MKRKIVILGGGLAGLAAAFELSKNSLNEVVVFEKEKEVGGLARTINYKGFLFEFGPHRFFTKNKYIENLVKGLLGKELRLVNRQTRIYFKGKFFSYPPTFSDTLKLGYWQASRIFLDYLWVRISSRIKEPKIRTLEDAYVDQFGRTLYQLFFEKYSEKIWGLPCSEISADWAVQRTRRMSISKVLKEMIFKGKEVTSLVEEFYFPKKGIGRIAERLTEEIKKNGGKILIGVEVKKVETKRKKIVAVEVLIKNKKKRLPADFAISTLPLTLSIKMFSPSPSDKVLEAARKLKYRDLVMVNLIVKRKKFTKDHWIYTQDPGIFNRVIQPKNFSEDLVPRKGVITLAAEYTTGKEEELGCETNRQFINKTVEALVEKLGFIKKEEVLDSFVIRSACAYPVYHLHYNKKIGILKKYLKNFSNFQTTGRAGLFRYNNMDHSILSGIYAARNIEGGNYNLDQTNVDQEYLEEMEVKS